ncbi:hypothetical protein [Cellulomonas composti]|uniref:Uncharacterized protein n=1 Tax=Cellulomonas composti TaxID=266130 RepID=A0A511JEH3_9CELL|nr:hypothetical protein [Cellulomonas composti]GEL96407.1 hypothetical protein CCO02nite_30650 [Cellulomonas composti]
MSGTPTLRVEAIEHVSGDAPGLTLVEDTLAEDDEPGGDQVSIRRWEGLDGVAVETHSRPRREDADVLVHELVLGALLERALGASASKDSMRAIARIVDDAVPESAAVQVVGSTLMAGRRLTAGGMTAIVASHETTTFAVIQSEPAASVRLVLGK